MTVPDPALGHNPPPPRLALPAGTGALVHRTAAIAARRCLGLETVDGHTCDAPLVTSPVAWLPVRTVRPSALLGDDLIAETLEVVLHLLEELRAELVAGGPVYRSEGGQDQIAQKWAI